MNHAHEDFEARVEHMETLFNQHPELDSLLTSYVVAKIQEHLSMGRHDFASVSVSDLKEPALYSMCRRICYAEKEVGARYSDEQLVDKMTTDLQRDMQSLKEYGLPATRSR